MCFDWKTFSSKSFICQSLLRAGTDKVKGQILLQINLPFFKDFFFFAADFRVGKKWYNVHYILQNQRLKMILQ
jgi:hypothetical protein